jgi:hypothetical protein
VLSPVSTGNRSCGTTSPASTAGHPTARPVDRSTPDAAADMFAGTTDRDQHRDEGGSP